MHNFDEIARGALDLAQSELLKRKNTELHPEHLLWGLVSHPKAHFAKAFKNEKSKIAKLLEGLPTTTGPVSLENVRANARFSEWVTYASSDAIQNGKDQIGERELVKFIPKIFPKLEIDFNKLSEQNTEGQEEAPKFLVNFNELAAQGKLDPVIGREKEIRSVMEILGRRGKNNPILVGPAGVGKTAIVEGLAEAIYKGSVPDVLKDKQVYSLDLGALMAGTKYRGEFEERMQALLKFVKDQAGQAILFIDEIHQLVGAGRTDGAMDAANLLKPALARGELHCIGATTEDEYQKYILGDAALARRFRSVSVREPSVEDAIEIMMGVKEKFEMHHGIKISDEAIYHSVILSNQYMPDKNLPDKCIDLIDEASSAMKLAAEAMPAHLVEMESEIRNKLILSKVEKDNADILKDVEELKKTFETEKAKWEKEVLAVKRLSELQGQIDRFKFEMEEAERRQDYNRAGELKYAVIPKLQKQLEDSGNQWVLGKKDIAQVISRHTGIPIEKILMSKQEKILELSDYLKNRVLGQEEAVDEIAGVLVASHAGLSDETRPLGSFLLLGPSGVGKTETAKAITQFLFNSERNLIRIDLSEFSEKHSVAKLIGAPAGYVGYDDGGVLTEAVRRNPYSVILFDEFEKAHEDFGDILLQILDDGRLTDNKGRTINFKNTIVLLTSNAKDYRNQFKPEVLGRLDCVLNFKHLGKEVHKKLIQRQVDVLNQRLHSKDLVITLDDQLVGELLERGFDDQYGARPLQSVFQKMVTVPLSKLLLAGKLPQGQILGQYRENEVTFATAN
jgi:ATP-dependent Clp protease ATP-binding subunit ClpB